MRPFDVRLEIVGLRVGGAAVSALVGARVRVRDLMANQRESTREAARADVAGVVLLPAVGAHVLAEGRRVRKALGALFALEGFVLKSIVVF